MRSLVLLLRGQRGGGPPLAGLLLVLGLVACHGQDAPSGAPPVPPAAPPSSSSLPGPAGSPSLSAVQAGPRPALVVLDNSDEALLQLAETRCAPVSVSPPAAPSLGGAGCQDRRAAAFFELASRWTSAEFAPPAQPETAVGRLAVAGIEALAEDAARLHGWVLASLGALAAIDARAQARLAHSPWPAAVLALLADHPTALLQGRALLALGALYRQLPSSPEGSRQAISQELAAGLRSADRFVSRQALVAAALSGEDALTAPILELLGRQLGQPSPEHLAVSPKALLTGLAAAKATLPSDMAAELAPLLPPFVDVLLSLEPPEAGVAATHLVDAAVASDPLSATAYFMLAKVRDGRRDGTALPALRRALSLGNLPPVFVAALGEQAAALSPAPDLPSARRQLRQILARRAALAPDPRRITIARLDGAAEQRPQIALVQPAQLEEQAARLVQAHGADSDAGRTLGRELFRHYPFASDEYYSDCLHSFVDAEGSNHDLLDRLGLQTAPHPEAGSEIIGLVATPPAAAASTATAARRLGVTCALCHTQLDSRGQRQDGLPSRSYDQGLLLAACIDQPIFHKSQNRNLEQLLDYGPGRNDSTADGVHDPTEIPSLFALLPGSAVRWNGDLPTLELQVDRNLSLRSAPPAVVALVAAYLRSLGPAWVAAQALQHRQAAAQPAQAALHSDGAAIFERECARCHSPPLYSHGQVVPIERLQTDRKRISAVLPNSSPGYKVPSLLAIARTAPYLHDGSVPTLEALLDSHRRGGHRFGWTLSRDERRRLLSFLRDL